MPSGSHSQTSLSLTAATVTEQTRPSTLFPRTRLRAQRPSDLQLAPSADLVTARSTTTDPDTAGPSTKTPTSLTSAIGPMPEHATASARAGGSEQRCGRGARRCSGCAAGLASGLRGLLRGAGCAPRHGRTRTFPSPRARSLYQLYRRGCPWEAPRPLGTGTKMRLREKAGRHRPFHESRTWRLTPLPASTRRSPWICDPNRSMDFRNHLQ
jgi:hypothetical protein